MSSPATATNASNQPAAEAVKPKVESLLEQLSRLEVAAPVATATQKDSLTDFFKATWDKVKWKLVGEFRADRDIKDFAHNLEMNLGALQPKAFVEAAGIVGQLSETYQNADHALSVQTLLDSVANHLQSETNQVAPILSKITEDVKAILGDKYPANTDVLTVLKKHEQLNLTRAQKEELRDLYRIALPKTLGELTEICGAAQQTLKGLTSKEGVIGILVEDQELIKKSLLTTEADKLPAGIADQLRDQFNEARDAIFASLSQALDALTPETLKEGVAAVAAEAMESLQGLHAATDATVERLLDAHTTLESIAKAEELCGLTTDGRAFIPATEEIAYGLGDELSGAVRSFWQATVGKAKDAVNGAIAKVLANEEIEVEEFDASLDGLRGAYARFGSVLTRVGQLTTSVATAHNFSTAETVKAYDDILEKLPEEQKGRAQELFEASKEAIEQALSRAFIRHLGNDADLERELQRIEWRSDMIEGLSSALTTAPEHAAVISDEFDRTQTYIENLEYELRRASKELVDAPRITEALNKKIDSVGRLFKGVCAGLDAQDSSIFASTPEEPSVFSKSLPATSGAEELVRDAVFWVKSIQRVPEQQRAALTEQFAQALEA